MRRAEVQGYEIHPVFVLTNNPEINVRRVKARVKAGRHDVPVEKIICRYERSLRNLPQIVRIADHTRVIDNSGEGPRMICEVVNMNLTIWESEQWSRPEVLCLSSGK